MGMVGIPSGYASSNITDCSANLFKLGVSTHWLPYAAMLSARNVSDTSRIRFRLLPVCAAGRSQCEPPSFFGGCAATDSFAADNPPRPARPAPFNRSLRDALLIMFLLLSHAQLISESRAAP